ncbi:MAG: glycosyltransferase [Anaerolineae bacterium]|nr:glycosyltransferase [Anaerolineae bacterium]
MFFKKLIQVLRRQCGGSFVIAGRNQMLKLRRSEQSVRRKLQWMLVRPNLPLEQKQLTGPDITTGSYDIVCLANIEWESRYQRPQQLMTQFGRNGQRVFYVIASQFVKLGHPKGFQANPVAPNVFEIQLQGHGPLNFYHDPLSEIQATHFLASIEQLKRQFHIHAAAIIVDLAYWTPLALTLRKQWHWPIIYNCMDEWADFPNIGPAILEQEKQLVCESDATVVTAALLKEKWLAQARQCHLVRNGVDFDFFEAHTQPNILLKALAHPIIGYYGALAEWVDFELIYYLATQRPTWNFVLIGDRFVEPLEHLEALPNVHLLGRQPYQDMPRYLYQFDVCILPFKLNAVTHAVDPVKLYEYFSCGKPTVAVPLHEIQIYADHLYLADSPKTFLTQLEHALAETDLALMHNRITLARTNNWHSRYTQFDMLVRQLFPPASIIIVTYNNLKLTQLCLESIIRNTTYPRYEIIIVDNHSTDGTRNYLRYLTRRFTHVSVILNSENRGFAAANNQGLKQAAGERLVLLNSDTVVPKGWLVSLLAHLRDPQIGLVGPVTNFIGNEAKIEVPYVHLQHMARFAAKHMLAHQGQCFDIHVLAMFCVGLRRDVFEAIGWLDEQFGIGMFEDDDYSYRVRAKGYRIVCARDTFVHHFGQAAFKKLMASGEYHHLWQTNQAYFESKWGRWIPHKHT